VTSTGAPSQFDFVVVGSGAAALTAALTASVGGLRVAILEKTDRIGGTSAMSGAGTWIPANHLARNAGIVDSPEEALTYLRSAAPDGWAEQEEPLWRAMVTQAGRMLAFVEQHTPLRYELTDEPDPFAEHPGGKPNGGRMVSPRALSRRLVGRYAPALRRSTLPHIFTYQEMKTLDPYHHPLRAGLRLLPKLAMRWLTDSRGQGSALITGLLQGCLAHGCQLELGARVTALSRDGSGRVTGVELEQRGVSRHLAATGGVLLATGGFEWDEALRATHFPGPFDRNGSPRANTGDGQRMAAAVGAQLDRMDQANVYPTIPTVYEGKPHGLPMIFQAEPHAIVVDRHGKRFVSEYDFNIGEAVDRRAADGSPLHLPAWIIGDRRFLRRSAPLRHYARQQPGWVRRSGDLASLARAIGVPEDALEQTVARFNAFCARGRDDDFGRGEGVWERYKAGRPADSDTNPALGSIERGPFVAIPFNRSILGTKGGARTDDRGRALRADGSLIEGLFCAGLAMANPIGTRPMGSGTTIGPNMTWGFIAATAVLGNAGPRVNVATGS
jgi:3-oxosteroid 1-dehydrogenase